MAKLDLLLFDAITETEEFLKDPISNAIIHDAEDDFVLLQKIAKSFEVITHGDAVQEVAANNSVFDDYDCIASTTTNILKFVVK